MTQILNNDYIISGNGSTFTTNESIMQFSPNNTIESPYDKELLLELEKSNKPNVKVPITGNLPIGHIFLEEYKLQENIRKYGKVAQNYYKKGFEEMRKKHDTTKLKIRGINDVYANYLGVTDDSKDSIFRDLIVEVSKNNEKYVGSVTHQLRRKMVVNELEILPYPDYEPDLISLVHKFEEFADESKLSKKIMDGYLKDYHDKIYCKIKTAEVMTDPVRFPISCYTGNDPSGSQQEYVVDRSSAESISKNTGLHPDSGEPFQMDQLEPADDIKELIEFCRFLGYA